MYIEAMIEETAMNCTIATKGYLPAYLEYLMGPLALWQIYRSIRLWPHWLHD